MKKYFEDQIKNNKPITKNILSKLIGKSYYSDYQIGDKVLVFIEQETKPSTETDPDRINWIMRTIVPRELNLLEKDFIFDSMKGSFPILIKK
ncbi:MAG: hypothetical protein PVG65_03450 [Candidatus Thorarchaeota archaeon]|jgi:hypothetical protein